jgi:hypothetical protein
MMREPRSCIEGRLRDEAEAQGWKIDGSAIRDYYETLGVRNSDNGEIRPRFANWRANIIQTCQR